METIDVPEGVGWTSLTTLAQRAIESEASNALFFDPLAMAVMNTLPPATKSALLQQEDKEVSGKLAFLRGYVALRTHYIDAALRHVIGSGVDQIVILGAGLDGRAYRLPWTNSARIFELDLSEVIKYKRKVAEAVNLSLPTDTSTVPVDLRDDWASALIATGFNARQPAVWIIEGVLNYLRPPAADTLLEILTALSSPDSWLIGTYLDGAAESALATVASTSRDASAERVASHRAGGPAEPPAIWLGAHQWTVETSTVARWASKLERVCPPVLNPATGGGNCWLFTARQTGQRP